jgi:hypothetical protein
MTGGLPAVRTWEDIQFIVDLLNSRIKRGTVVPNTRVMGRVGDLYVNTAGGASTTLYVKESGNNTNTGWVAK